MKKNLYIVGFLSLILFSALSAHSNSYLLDNLSIVSRKERGANENRRDYTPKTNSGTIEYKPSKQTEYQKKFQKAEEYVIKKFKTEFKIDWVLKKSSKWGRLKRPISIKKKKRKIIVHHTAESLQWINSLSWEIEVIQHIYKFHTFTRERWDIGYNYLIGPLGTLYEGRYWWPNAVGAHATWNNTESIGIALLGNFDIEEPTAEQLNTLKKLLTALSKKYSINPMENVIYHSFNQKSKEPYIINHNFDSFIGHKDVWSTSCPWENLYSLLPNIKRYVAAQLWYTKAIPQVEEIKSKSISNPIIKRK